MPSLSGATTHHLPHLPTYSSSPPPLTSHWHPSLKWPFLFSTSSHSPTPASPYLPSTLQMWPLGLWLRGSQVLSITPSPSQGPFCSALTLWLQVRLQSPGAGRDEALPVQWLHLTHILTVTLRPSGEEEDRKVLEATWAWGGGPGWSWGASSSPRRLITGYLADGPDTG